MKIPGVLMIAFFLTAGHAAAAETVKQREQRDAYRTQLEFRLREVNQKIAQASVRTSDVREESRQEYDQLSRKMREKQTSAQKKLEELQSATGLDADRLKAETHFAITELNELHSRMSTLAK